MKVLVCGDREWSDYQAILRRLRSLPQGAEIIHGAARGADSLAGQAAQELGLPVTAFPAHWTTYGRAAGPIRNQQMLDEWPDLVIAFHADLAKSKGTADMVKRARRKGVSVEVYS